ncbi:putative Integral membrane protein [Seiridium cardinale]
MSLTPEQIEYFQEHASDDWGPSDSVCLYCRIFFPVKSLFYISWGFGIFILAYNLALIFVTAFECIPLSSMWKGAPGRCIDTLPPFTTLGIINVVTDVGILALPVRHIMQLRLNITQRIKMCGIFLLGGLVCVFGIIRVVALARAPPGDPSCKYRSIFNMLYYNNLVIR